MGELLRPGLRATNHSTKNFDRRVWRLDLACSADAIGEPLVAVVLREEMLQSIRVPDQTNGRFDIGTLSTSRTRLGKGSVETFEHQINITRPADDLAIVGKPKVEDLRDVDALASTHRCKRLTHPLGNHQAALQRTMWVALFCSTPGAVNAPTRQVNGRGFVMAPSGPTTEIGQSFVHRQFNVIPLKAGEAVHEVDVDGGQHPCSQITEKSLFENIAGMDQDFGASRKANSILPSLQHQLSYPSFALMECMLGNHAPQDFADTNGPQLATLLVDENEARAQNPAPAHRQLAMARLLLHNGECLEQSVDSAAVVTREYVAQVLWASP